jgi:predicted secreted protein
VTPVSRLARTSTAPFVVGALLVVSLLLLALVAGCGSGPTSTSDTGGSTATSASAGSTDTSTETTAGESAAPDSLKLSQEDNGGTFEVRAGSIIQLSLKIDAGSGRSWQMDDPDPEASLLEQVGEPTRSFEDSAGPARALIVTFTLKAVDRGEMTVRFIYVSADPTEEPTDTFEIVLIVK